MAIIVPAPHLKHLKMTSGERRFAARLLAKLEDDYLCWFNVPIGTKQLRPDFVVLHPGRGILVLEVKDWKLDTLQEIDRRSVRLITSRGLVREINPLEQARHYALHIVDLLQADPLLTQQDEGRFQGKLLFPWGYGVVLSNISRKQFQEAQIGLAIEPHNVICQDEMLENVGSEAFQQRLWGMFNYSFGGVMSLARVDRIRWHLFPEIRISSSTGALFDEPDEAIPDHGESIAKVLPDIVRVMDMQQEQLARNLGEGHRIVHGVAGSGKTLILAYRCLHLKELALRKPILVLCYNVTLASKLRQMLATHGVGDTVHIYSFHQWCGDQLRLYQVDYARSRDYGENLGRMIDALSDAVTKNRVPRAQYAAILIDEGHDFEPDWFRLVVQMIDPETNSLLLLYDDAQSIYERRQKFSWASVGIQAKGRTTILKINYRNTVELLTVAYDFVGAYIAEGVKDEEIPLVEPSCVGRRGAKPEIDKLANFEAEIARIADWLLERRSEGVAGSDMAVIYRYKYQAEKLEAGLKKRGIDIDWITRDKKSRNYDPARDCIKLVTMHSSKGLEFHSVAIPDIGKMPHPKEAPAQEARLLYVAMTRATDRLLLTHSTASSFTNRLQAVIAGANL